MRRAIIAFFAMVGLTLLGTGTVAFGTQTTATTGGASYGYPTKTTVKPSPTQTTVKPSPTPKKVKVCHKGKTIEISVNALDAHLAHGDYKGPCKKY
jgi:hypothetical protein